MSFTSILPKIEEEMKKVVAFMLHEFVSIRTGKASTALAENIDVIVYGSSMKLKQLAMITAPESRLLVIQPFDASTLQEIEKAIFESKIGITPVVQGKSIQLRIPELSQERRKELVKMVHSIAEESKIKIRSMRRNGLDEIKKLQKSGAITEDELERSEKDIQRITDKYIIDLEKHMQAKENDLMKV